MENWLQQVSAASKQRNGVARPDVRLRHRREFLRCTAMVRRALTDLARTYWPTTARRQLRVSHIPIDPIDCRDPLSWIRNRFYNHGGWRVRNVRSKEAFEVFLASSPKGFFFELPSEYRTTDTSKEQLQDALCKHAIEGPIGYGDRDVLDLR